MCRVGLFVEQFYYHLFLVSLIIADLLCLHLLTFFMYFSPVEILITGLN